jgi:PncC family amidohydrolase
MADSLIKLLNSGLYSVSFNCFGIEKNNLQRVLAPVKKEFSDLEFSVRLFFPELFIVVSGKDKSRVESLQNRMVLLLKDWFFSFQRIALPDILASFLLKSGLTISVAESCTGGLLGHELTRTSGSSSFFKGGIIAYADSVKISALGVSADLINRYGAVSREVVTHMASGAVKVFDTDLSVAISGIAGPLGGTEEKPVGTVHIALAHKEGVVHKKSLFKGYNRKKVKIASAWTAMKMILDFLPVRR